MDSPHYGLYSLCSAGHRIISVDTEPGSSSIRIRCPIKYQIVAKNQIEQIINAVKVAFSLSFIPN